MKRKDIQLLELLEVDPEQGTIYFNDQRIVLQSVEAIGIFRRELIHTLGVGAARRLLIRYGYAHGYHDTRSASEHHSSTLIESVELAVSRHTMLGGVQVEPLEATSLPGGGLRTSMIWRNSFEAEEHLRHFGPSKIPVCWMALGYASGSRSAATGRDVYYRESMCVAKGDPYCKIEGRDADGWGAELPDILNDFTDLGTHPGTVGELREELERMRIVAREQRHLLAKYQGHMASPESEHDELRARIANLSADGKFIVRSRRMSEVIDQAIRIAPLQTSVLVQGESGTGKEFIVNLIHQQSSRSSEPLVAINCAALSESLLESELFGHVRGAFTGAVRDKMGLFELARNSTLFLDEIGEMQLSLQAKLLRVLENGEIRRVGGDRILKVRPRILAATNRDLRAQVAAGTFRSDLFYRLEGFLINVPPLRERTEEIAALAHEFMRQSGQNIGKQVTSIRPEAMARLIRYPWPGNIRELKHAIESSVIVTQGSAIEVKDLPAEIASRAAACNMPVLDLKAHEREVILEAMRRFNGNRTMIARALNISSVTLWRKMRRLGIDSPSLTRPQSGAAPHL